MQTDGFPLQVLLQGCRTSVPSLAMWMPCFQSDLEAKIAKAIEEKDFAAIYTSAVREMEMDDFEPDFEVLSR